MAEARIPVDLVNPGQVFACLGFLEAADVLFGEAEGGFDWNDSAKPQFSIRTPDSSNPVEEVLGFLAKADLGRWTPKGYLEKGDGNEASQLEGDWQALCPETFPSEFGDRMALPIRLSAPDRPSIVLGHWADSSSRDNFKLYAGNRSAADIVRAMLFGVREKPRKGQRQGDLRNRGIKQLWEEKRSELVEQPFHVLTPMGGSFNFDPRGAWTAIDTGYSPNDQDHDIAASPVVEFLGAWGLEHARPRFDPTETRLAHYAVWGVALPPMLARCALTGGIPSIASQYFRFRLNLSGKNKVIMFATLETHL
jgi:CRISPR-associated protein Csx14